MKHIIVCGWVRCGNRWLARLLAYYADERGNASLTVQKRFDQNYWMAKLPVHYFGQEATINVSHIRAEGYWKKGAWNCHRGSAEDTHIVHIQRDPRDAFVSWYHMIGNSLPPGKRTWKGYLSWVPEQRLQPFRPHIESWLDLEATAPPNVSWVSHEQMMEDRAEGLLRVATEMGLPADHERACQAAGILAAEPARTSYHGAGATQRGVSEWRQHFDAQDARLVEGFCGDLIVRLGYGGDPDWERLLERTESV